MTQVGIAIMAMMLVRIIEAQLDKIDNHFEATIYPKTNWFQHKDVKKWHTNLHPILFAIVNTALSFTIDFWHFLKTIKLNIIYCLIAYYCIGTEYFFTTLFVLNLFSGVAFEGSYYFITKYK